MLDRKTNDKIKKIISVFSICINKECKMNNLVCEHFTALLTERRIQNRRRFFGNFMNFHLNFFQNLFELL